MEQVSKQHEAKMKREAARQIRAHVSHLGATMSLEQQLAWMGVAERAEQLACALELEPIGRVA